MNSFKITTALPTLNEYINLERTNKFIASAMKKKNTELCSRYALQMPKLDNVLYDLELLWTVPNSRKDPDNVYFAVKFILDGVVKAGRLTGDGMKNIRNIHHNIQVVKGESSVLIIFVPIEQ